MVLNHNRQSLFNAFAIAAGEVITLIGGGGKTTTMFRLAREARERDLRVVITTTTKICSEVGSDCCLVIAGDEREAQAALKNSFCRGLIPVWGTATEGPKLIGIRNGAVSWLRTSGEADLVLVEGDGSRGRSFKVPRPHEPVIPEATTLVIPVIGADCIGAVLDEEHFFNLQGIMELTGLRPGDTVTPEIIADLVMSGNGYAKNVGPGMKWVPFINKADDEGGRKAALGLGGLLVERGANRVVIGAAASPHPATVLYGDML